MPRKTQEDYIRLVAARAGLKLITNRYSITSGKKSYCLRPVWDARHAVGILSEGGFGLVKTTTNRKGRRRQTVASWLSLDAIERMLLHWPEAGSRNSARVSQRRRPNVVAIARPRSSAEDLVDCHLWASIGASERSSRGATNDQD